MPLEFVFSPCDQARCQQQPGRSNAVLANERWPATHRRNDSIRLSFPKRNVSIGVNNDMASLSSGLGTCYRLHRLDLGRERLLRAECVQWKVSIFELRWHFVLLFSSCSLCNYACLHATAACVGASLSQACWATTLHTAKQASGAAFERAMLDNHGLQEDGGAVKLTYSCSCSAGW